MFRPWKLAPVEVLRKTPPRTQKQRARDILRAWHLSMPSQLDVDRLAHLVEASVPDFEGIEGESATDGSIDERQHVALFELQACAEEFRERLSHAIALLAS